MEKLEKAMKAAEKMRSEWAESDAKRDSGLESRADVCCISDIVYTESETEDERLWHLADIFYPVEKQDNYPVIVSVHGGGWFYGDKKLYSHYCELLASYGFAVVDFNYRLSPKYKYPAGFLDVCHLMEFIKVNAGKYSLDMDRLFGVGDSAGAQLLSQYCVASTNAEYRSLIPGLEDIQLPVPKRVALNCGIYNMKDMANRDQIVEWYLTADDLDAFKDKCELSDIAKSFWDVFDHITGDFPETYLMLSVNDDLKIHTYPMKKKLEEKGVYFVFREFGEDCTDDGHVFHVNMKSENGHKCNSEEIEFFRGIK